MRTAYETYFSPSAIKLAYYRVLTWQDKMIKDRIGLKAFGSNLDENCALLSEKITTGQYKPTKGIKFYQPKASRTQRTKTLLFIEDALVYQAMANHIAHKAFPKVHQHDHFVFGSVLHPNVAQGLALLEEPEPEWFFFQYWKGPYQKFTQSIIKAIEQDKVSFKFETDITGFFDSIPHYNLLLTLSESFGVEDEILDLLGECLNRWSGTKENSTPGVGIPQGPAPSFLLANLLLFPLDEIMVGKGSKYYRYMDDVHIYDYEESSLLDVLVLIDNYTKGHGLSINSKKTSIEAISEDSEDETVKELKKIQFVSAIDEEDVDMLMAQHATLKQEPPKLNLEAALTNKINLLSEQDQSDGLWGKLKHIETLTDPDAIRAFWLEQQAAAEQAIRTLFLDDQGGMVHTPVKEADFLGSLFQYASATRELMEQDASVKPVADLLQVWLHIYQHYFWKANMFYGVLNLYAGLPELKTRLTALYKTNFKNYEWVRYQTITLLATTQQFTDRELRTEFFPALKVEDSLIVRIALYRLLLSKSNDRQFRVSVEQELMKEKEPYLKLTVLDFMQQYTEDRSSLTTLLQTIGL